MGSLSPVLRRRWLALILTTLLLAGGLNCAIGPNGIYDLMRLSRYRVHLIGENDRLKSENAQLESQVGKLHSDDAYIQRVIRQELGWARPDEFVYLFPSADKSRH